MIPERKELSVKTTSPWFAERFSYWFLKKERQWELIEGKKKWWREYLESIEVKPGQKILDVGCGIGDLAVLFKKKAQDSGYVAGIAPTKYFIDECRKTAEDAKVDVDFRIGNMEKLEFEDSSFDLVTCNAVMMNVKDSTKIAGLKEMFRVLKPGGKIVMGDLAKPPRTWWLPLNFWYYCLLIGVSGRVFWLGRFKDMMKDAEFTDIEETNPIREHVMWLSFYTGIKKL